MDVKRFLNNYLDFITRLIPQPRKSVVGFDIGTSSVKAVEITYGKEGLEIHNWAVEPLDGLDAKAAIKKISARMNIVDQIPVASVSGKGTLIRYVEMPRMPIEDLRKAFVYEIDKYFPFDPQTIYTDCYVIDAQSQEKKLSVLVVAAKKELVDDRIQLFKDVGMNLTHVTTSSIATANAFERLVKNSAGGARAILDIGGGVSNLMILDKNNSPSFTRDIFVGSNDMTKQIANTLGVSMEEATRLKREPGDKSSQILQACASSMDNLTTEIQLSLDYFKTEKNATISEIYLVGGGALLKDIEGVFEKKLNVPVKQWNALTGVKLGPAVQSTDINTYGSQLGVAIGLALTKV